MDVNAEGLPAWRAGPLRTAAADKAAQVRKHGGAMDVNAEGLPAWRAGPLRTAAADKAAQVRKHGGAMDGPPCV
ncbi:MAG: hypothetical protein DWI03_11090 [Planctomycetota bacterium]|nr:MAG: hypothetical protein DWI03_11090 [Planctomycetota bacterium]